MMCCALAAFLVKFASARSALTCASWGRGRRKGRVKALIEEAIIDVRDESEQRVQRALSLALVDRE
jgi:hypothetical protein